MTTPPLSERRVVLLIGAIQFVNILDFMMVMPLGPDFARDLGIDSAMLGLIGGSYTAAAAVSGIVCSLFLDRFDRRSALALAMLGLVIGTAAGGFATGLHSLMATRVVAGAFGGPATSLSLAIIADVIPADRRGRALGAVMSSFAVASVLGVPAGLELARLGGWQTPFFAVAGLGALVVASALWMLPRMTSHLDREAVTTPTSTLSLLSRAPVALTLIGFAAVMFGNFAIVPNLATYLQYNLGYPRDALGILYMAGGLVSFLVMRVVGQLVDRFGASRLATVGTVLYVGDLFFGFIAPAAAVPVMVIFVGFMVSSAVRMVPLQTVSSRVPSLQERARFMSSTSAVQHISCSLGSMLGSAMLTSTPNGRLIGMSNVAAVSATVACALPVLISLVEGRLRTRDASAAAALVAP